MVRFAEMVNSKAGKTVWILGSGFSKSLGGPLLPDLLSHRGCAYQKAKFPDIRHHEIYDVYWSHLKGAPESNLQPIYWDHAEEFLEFVNSAGSPESPRHSILSEAAKTLDTEHVNVRDFAEDALKCVAAECLFTSHAYLGDEAWKPYLDFPKMLQGGEDTIVTFNYDLVLEEIGAHLKAGCNFGPGSVMRPARKSPNGLTFEQELSDCRAQGLVPILKLHGSLNWTTIGNGITPIDLPDVVESLQKGVVPVIATPGPSKALLQKEAFRPLWDAAVAALKEAKVIVFMGYRFPPSDSQARGTLLEAIGENTNDYVRIHTVLGPRTNDDDTVRLRKLLEHVLRSVPRREKSEPTPSSIKKNFEIISHPLYVEDFLTVLHPKLLYGPLHGTL